MRMRETHHCHFLVLLYPPPAVEALTDFVYRQHKLRLQETDTSARQFIKKERTTDLQRPRLAHPTPMSLKIIDRRLRRAPQPPKPPLLALLAAPPMAEREAPHEHPDAAPALMRRAELEAPRGLREAVREVVRDAELEVLLGRLGRAGRARGGGGRRWARGRLGVGL